MFGKAGGRQGDHFGIFLKPGEGTAKEMCDITVRFTEQAFGGEYEVVVAVHTDKNHLHAHIVINRVNMVRISVAEKVRCYPLNEKGTDSAFEIVKQCHLLKQISVKNQESAFSYP